MAASGSQISRPATKYFFSMGRVARMLGELCACAPESSGRRLATAANARGLTVGGLGLGSGFDSVVGVGAAGPARPQGSIVDSAGFVCDFGGRFGVGLRFVATGWCLPSRLSSKPCPGSRSHTNRYPSTENRRP